MSGTASGGEREGDRAVMERNTKDLRDSGVPQKKAEEMARESLRRVDRRLREKGER